MGYIDIFILPIFPQTGYYFLKISEFLAPLAKNLSPLKQLDQMN